MNVFFGDREREGSFGSQELETGVRDVLVPYIKED